ncbi:MAG: ATP-binding cassette domain-containing protein [Haloarculaceae archaeon]
MIDVEDLAVSRGETTVFEDVSLSVDTGEFLALVGPNGAGKTTLLQTMTGVLAPDDGRVLVTDDGTRRDVHALSSAAASRLLASVPQGTELAFDFDVRDVVAMGRTPHRSRFERATMDDREAVDRALERTETAHLADRPVGAVSGGERQRVLLARALAQATPGLLLDEPTASLDIHHQIHTLDLVADLVAEGKTAVAAIHDLDLAARYCDRLALLADGGLEAVGPPETVLRREVLESAFGARATVTTSPVTGTPTVTAHSARPDRDERVHVLGGGRAGARALAALDAAGFRLSAGVLPEGDVAAETARALDATIVCAPPFESPADPTLSRARELVEAADAVVVAAPPGRPNETLLERDVGASGGANGLLARQAVVAVEGAGVEGARTATGPGAVAGAVDSLLGRE